MAYKVLKPIPVGLGQFLLVGEIVEADSWRNLRQLVNGRYLAQVIAMDKPKPEAEARKQRKETANGSAK